MMNNHISVTILMPIYKVERYLNKTLQSIFSQTYPYLNYVFVDDCSPDSSLDILIKSLKTYHIPEDRYTIVRHEENKGIAVSRTDCIAKADGDYVLFVDSDDWIEDNMVEQLVLATKNGEIDMVGSDFYKDYESGKSTLFHEDYAITCRENMIKCLNYDISTVLWKLLIRRSLFNNITITPHVDIVEDYIISVKLYYYAKSFVALHSAFYHYVQYNQARVSFQSLRSVKMHILGVREVELFLRDKGLWNEHSRHLMMLRKFNIRSNFLTKHLLDYDAYADTFPETKGMWRFINYTKKEKIKFWLADKHLFCILRLIQKRN